MVRFYKRPSDTTPFLVLYWTTLIAAALGLIFYAKDRIQTVLQRKTAVQTSRILATPENPYIPLPDVIVCGRNLTINTDEYSTEYYTLDEISLDPDNQIPCGTLFFELPGVRVDMFIFRSKNGTVHMNPEFLYFDFPNFGNGSSMFYILHPQTSVFNKYRQTNETPTPSQLMDDVHLMKSASVKDTQYVRRDIHLVQVEFSTTETHTLEDSFWGYFGRRSKNVVYSMNMDFSSVMGRSDTQETTFHLIPQPWRIVEEDTL
ncbi:hypothetical protein B0O80DRAFT_256439 [Mortierella sp. GBAus27b]|nr:hypothetical protein B0O80DRAFT_256439 [Mortierella sp. GBAus27b]